jgi:hypothetical protein
MQSLFKARPQDFEDFERPNTGAEKIIFACALLSIAGLIYGDSLWRSLDRAAWSTKWDGVWTVGDNACWDGSPLLIIGNADSSYRASAQDVEMPTLSRVGWWKAHASWFDLKAKDRPKSELESKSGRYFVEWPGWRSFANFEDIDEWTLKFTGLTKEGRHGRIHAWNIDLASYLGKPGFAMNAGTVLKRCVDGHAAN